MELTDDLMYKALIEKDSSFEGLFYAAVKTTGIFCRPTCTAKKPKKENVEFFTSTRNAIIHGYRPCKICAPLEYPDKMPDHIKSILDEIKADTGIKFKDYDLRKRNIEPNTLRRWFKKYHGITFHGYQRMMRVNKAFNMLQQGETVTGAAFNTGYESISGFTDNYKAVTGLSPSQSMNKKIIIMTRFETPLGPVFSCAVEEGICLFEFTDRRMLESELKMLTKSLNGTIVNGDHHHFDILKKEIREYFNKERKEFSVPLYPVGTDFQKNVWNELLRIPYGKTRSYKQQAVALKNPNAVRAVANANGMNKIAVIIPCHRVIGDDGHLTGYGGGLWRKKYLLDLEVGNSAIALQGSFSF
jgi:AraC family transcriptional regulator of adaptative response/methylated-DNA-[protein]-cysteine methyltransferase